MRVRVFQKPGFTPTTSIWEIHYKHWWNVRWQSTGAFFHSDSDAIAYAKRLKNPMIVEIE